MAKIIENYANFDIKLRKDGKYIARTDRDLKEYTGSFAMGEYDSVELAKAGIDRYWEMKK